MYDDLFVIPVIYSINKEPEKLKSLCELLILDLTESDMHELILVTFSSGENILISNLIHENM